ncbi:MAG TPA: serine hydrolase domain-containing protein [Streptosporangiaceae bacterium]|nr:serine hydrolase domain-containing protein [Streptosporangiaceae bacterium]
MPGPGGGAFQKALDLIRKRGSPAQLCIVVRGQIVLNEAFGCRPDSLFFLFSASKPLVALLVHRLAERGDLALDDPVAKHWPQFGQAGKQDITIRQVLQHRSGLPVARSMARDAIVMTDWTASVRALEVAAPSFPPGSVPAYHVISYGFILGELVQRVTGAPVREVLQAELLGPLGLADSYLGLPASQWHRHVPVSGSGPAELVTQVVINRRATRQAVIPAASVSATAYDLARLYQALLDGGELGGVRVLRPETIRQATTPTSDGEIDRYLKLPVRWSEGFQLGGERTGRARAGAGPGPMGALASRTAFGHNGSYVCLGWADPQRQVAVGYLTGRLVSRSAGASHMAAVSDAILSGVS